MNLDFAGTARFRILSRLGEGGMGVVYEAIDREKNVRVALKTLNRAGATSVARFKDEFRTIADLTHPNVVALGELYREGDLWFYTMELVEGVDFLRYVRTSQREGDKGHDDAKLRSTLAQLAEALTTLHRAGKVHRDVKPSNVLVTRAGRAVLLDFGLALDLERPRDRSEPALLGTVDYMAPEQAGGAPAGPEADWYSVGVLLYEALTGAPPFDGSALEVLTAKCNREPLPPSARVSGLPPDLDALCRGLLRRLPAERLTGDHVLRLVESAPRVSGPMRAVGPPSVRQLIGRHGELATLEAAFAKTRGGGASAIAIEGESGVGKSLLVAHFLETLGASQPELLALTGRCNERESVPYKAFDGIMDALARYMSRLSRGDAEMLLPMRASLLGQVFPTLRRVAAVAEAPPPPATMDAVERRRQVFLVLKSLFSRIADQRPLVLVIDDLQWADDDSLALMASLLGPPEPPSLLLVATMRPDPAHGERPLPPGFRRLPLGGLPADEAAELVTALAGRRPAKKLDIAQIVADTGGHPLFIQELVRHTLVTQVGVADTVRAMPRAEKAAEEQGRYNEESGRAVLTPRLEDALWSRIQSLDAEPRDLLELISVAGVPLPQETAAAALGVDLFEFMRVAATLRAANLARTGGPRPEDVIETYHDRVRETVLARIDPELTRQDHRRLAETLEAAGSANPERLAIHWEGAGDEAKASSHAERAGDGAAEALAFQRAARLYWRVAGSAVWTQAHAPAEVRALHVKLGDALVNCGRGVEAAAAYLAAAGDAEATPDAPGTSELHRRAAEQLLRSGRIKEGRDMARAALRQLGMTMAETPRGALVSLLWRRLRLRLRGLHFEADRQQPNQDHRQLDLCWSIALTLGMVDTIHGADFQTRHLLLALAAGDRYRIARALALEAAYSATGGRRTHKRTARVIAMAQAVAAESHKPHAVGLALMCKGVAAILEGDFQGCRDDCAGAEAIFRDQCVGVFWEMATSRLYQLVAMAGQGDVRRLGELTREQIAHYEERGDLYTVTSLRGSQGSFACLLEDDADAALREVAAARELWSKEGFHLQHYWCFISEVQAKIYRGEPQAAWQTVVETWPALLGSKRLFIEYTRIEAEQVRARAALAAAKLDPARLADAAQAAGRLEREPVPRSLAHALLVRAALANLRGDVPAARALLERAVPALEAADLRLFAAAARRKLGDLMGGESGAQLVAEADHDLTARGVRNPPALAAMLVPGF